MKTGLKVELFLINQTILIYISNGHNRYSSVVQGNGDIESLVFDCLFLPRTKSKNDDKRVGRYALPPLPGRV